MTSKPATVKTGEPLPAVPNPSSSVKDPSSYYHNEGHDASSTKPRAFDRIDHSADGGPIVSYIWCQSDSSSSSSTLKGQELYLGAEIGSDGKMYCIPGHARQVLQMDPETNKSVLMGCEMPGKYKWLRGVLCGDNIYGLPCHTDTILKIHVPSGAVTQLPIPYEDFFESEQATQQRQQEWKFHGGNISPVDGCIYTVPQSASHVLKLDPTTDECSFFGPPLPGRYKWYGGVVGKIDGAIYGIPHNSSQVLRIHPADGVTLHGDFGLGGHKWHGACAAADGTIVCVPANADTVLCIQPASPAPVLTELGDSSVLKSGRHRPDTKYKYLGATCGPDGRVYCFPCAAEKVLAVNSAQGSVHLIGPNIYDENIERICNNKWQNGVYCAKQQCIFGVPLAGESVLRIQFKEAIGSGSDPEISTWLIPSPHKGLSKWEGGVVAPNGVAYTVPNNHKAILRIEQTSNSTDQSGTSKNESIDTARSAARPDYSIRDDLVYKSGIPTLRASAHRVKFSLKNRKHDPRPMRNGVETGTLWLPEAVRKEFILNFDSHQFDFVSAVKRLLKGCDKKMVGTFRNDSEMLEDFVVPTQSTWRTVNGGQCEDAQRYLSDQVAADENFLCLFDKFVTEAILPNVKSRLVSTGAIRDNDETSFYYQRPPTLRLQPGPAWSQVKPHNDAEYGHQNGELNFWLPLTDRLLTGVDLWSESAFKEGDYHPIPASVGEIISFHGSSCRHYVNTNATMNARVSFDFRVGVQGFFDPTWEMQGTNDDHTRREVNI